MYVNMYTHCNDLLFVINKQCIKDLRSDESSVKTNFSQNDYRKTVMMCQKKNLLTKSRTGNFWVKSTFSSKFLLTRTISLFSKGTSGISRTNGAMYLMRLAITGYTKSLRYQLYMMLAALARVRLNERTPNTWPRLCYIYICTCL